MRRIEVTYSTMGQSSPASERTGGWYRWNGDPGKSEEARKAGKGAECTPQQRHGEREERLGVFTAARERGLGLGPAGREAGVTFKTAQAYERDRKARAKAQGAQEVRGA